MLPGNTSDPHFVVESLLSGKVDEALIELYAAAQHRDILEHPDIELLEIKKFDAAYGVALAGEAKRLEICMERYFRNNEENIAVKLQNKTVQFKVYTHDKTLRYLLISFYLLCFVFRLI